MKKKITNDIPVHFIFPLLLIVTLVPLIVHLKVIPLDEISFQFWTGQKENTDFFSYYKAIALIVLSIAALALFFRGRYKGDLKTKNVMIYYVPMALYTFMILLSTVFSQYPEVAQWGFVDRYEGAFVLFAYMAILFTTINMIDSEKHIRIILAGLFISSFVLGSIGIFQFFGADFFKSELGKALILPGIYRGSNLNFTFGPHTIYATLYNTNFVGSFMAMLLPLTMAAFLYVKNTYLKIIAGGLTCLMFANWIGCRSRAGYVGGAIALIFLLIFMRKTVVKNIKTLIPLFICFFLIFIGMDSAANGELGGRIFTSILSKNANNIVSSQNNVTSAFAKVDLKDIVFSNKKVSIVSDTEILNLGINGNEVAFTDTQGKKLVIKKDADENITFEDQRYSLYMLAFDKSQNTIAIQLGDMQFGFYVEPDGFKIIGERNVLLDKIDHPEAVGFEGKEKFASARGFIWSRSIPLLKNNILIGGGSDTYAIQFPQHDYVGKLRAFGKVNEIVDKPHNMYLQIGINTGILSLLAVLFLIVVYLINSFKIYIKMNQPNGMNITGAALFTAVLGYAIVGMANDSLVSVAPVFWVILGLGISCNYINTSKYKGCIKK